jgi:hypothetical protein
MHPAVLCTIEEGWQSPTNQEVFALKNHVNYSTNELAVVAGIAPKNLRAILSERRYIRGARIEYSVWRLWLQLFELVPDMKLNHKRPSIRHMIFPSAAKWMRPVVRECRLINLRAGVTDEQASKLMGVSRAVLENMLSKEPNAVIDLDRGVWFDYLDKLSIGSIDDFCRKPDLSPLTLLDIRDGYVAPAPLEVRKLLAWSGYSLIDAATSFGVDANKLRFYTSPKAERLAMKSVSADLFNRSSWKSPLPTELQLIASVVGLRLDVLAKRLGLDAAAVRKQVRAVSNSRLDVNFDKWFEFIQAESIESYEEFDTKVSEVSSRARGEIPYSLWRMMLSTFDYIDLNRLERKVTRK